MKFLRFFVVILLFAQCRQNGNIVEEKGNTRPVPNVYARFFSLEKYPGFVLLHVKQPYPGGKPKTYVLLPRDQHGVKLADSLKNFPVIPVPVKRIVATSVTHLEPLEVLGAGEKLVGFANTGYIQNPYFQERVRKGLLAETGNGIMLNTEKVLQLKPDVILGFSSGEGDKNDAFFVRHGIPYLYIAEWIENHPLGRAEWIKVFGLLTGAEEKAERIFSQITERYHKTAAKASKQTYKPQVFQGGIYKDKFYVPGRESWAAVLIRDAGGKYAVNGPEGTAGHIISFEQALIYLNRSDVWLNPGTFTSKRQILKLFPGLQNTKPVRKGEIWSLYNNAYFEKSVLHPDAILEDLYRIFSRDTSDTRFHFAVKIR